MTDRDYAALGRLGGIARRDKVPLEQRRAEGAKGGRATLERHGIEHYIEMGEKGGAIVAEKRGAGYYSAMGRKSAENRKAQSRAPLSIEHRENIRRSMMAYHDRRRATEDAA